MTEQIAVSISAKSFARLLKHTQSLAAKHPEGMSGLLDDLAEEDVRMEEDAICEQNHPECAQPAVNFTLVESVAQPEPVKDPPKAAQRGKGKSRKGSVNPNASPAGAFQDNTGRWHERGGRFMKPRRLARLGLVNVKQAA